MQKNVHPKHFCWLQSKFVESCKTPKNDNKRGDKKWQVNSRWRCLDWKVIVWHTQARRCRVCGEWVEGLTRPSQGKFDFIQKIFFFEIFFRAVEINSKLKIFFDPPTSNLGKVGTPYPQFLPLDLHSLTPIFNSNKSNINSNINIPRFVLDLFLINNWGNSTTSNFVWLHWKFIK